jgi:osmotically inducible protein OsmC
MNMKVMYRTPTITSVGGRDGSVCSADGNLDLRVSRPKEMGGSGDMTNPEELFGAGYAACFHSALKHVAAEKKIALGQSTVQANVSLGANDKGPGFMLAVELHVTVPNAEAATAQEVVRAAHTICPYSNATRNNIDVRLSVTAADGKKYDLTS